LLEVIIVEPRITGTRFLAGPRFRSVKKIVTDLGIPVKDVLITNAYCSDPPENNLPHIIVLDDDEKRAIKVTKSLHAELGIPVQIIKLLFSLP
jgi:hypothetical protein